ncbi:S9 family peptidase [Beijerinckiaceae bacterium]|nr:S9 family peptidase [Beijerinckiaceae bacterium]
MRKTEDVDTAPQVWPLQPPPAIEQRKAETTVHGITLSDDFAWLRAANWQDVLRDPAALPDDIRRVIETENDYARAILAHAAELRKELVKEMRGRIKEDDADVPSPDGPWLYYTRHNQGGQHPVFCRTKRPGGGLEEILLDGDFQGRGKAFFEIGAVHHAPDHAKLAWSADETGSELYSIRVRGIAARPDNSQPKDRGEVITDTDGSFVWMTDSNGFYYVRTDENHRPAEVYRHRIGTDPSADICVFEAHDPGLFIFLKHSQSGRFAVISIADHDSSECHLLDLADLSATARPVEPRAPGLRYDVEDHQDRLFIRTNADGAEDFKIMSAPLATPGKSSWVEEVPHLRGHMIIRLAVYPDYLVRLERAGGLPRIVVRHLASGDEHAIAFSEEAYSLGLEERLEYETNTLRFNYSSMTTPWETYDYDLVTRERILRKRQSVPSGHDPSQYVTRRLFAKAPDGEDIPISILHRAGLRLDGSSPVLLYGYGAYGSPVPASFSTNRLSLVDRGFIYAIAHVRGGTDKGWHWYSDGKLGKKPNSFTDFIAAAKFLIAAGYTAQGKIVAQGGSAGGMLMGAVVNLAPELFAGVIADVPFVDVLNTMLDASLPLTPPEWLEWGNPIADQSTFTIMRSYSPYENIGAKHYPPILALGGLTDPRVTYWEPLKWVARLRAMMTGGGPILLKTNMGAGHGGAPGRFDHLEDVALQYAFALACVEGKL